MLLLGRHSRFTLGVLRNDDSAQKGDRYVRIFTVTARLG
jgi:hypothetical protein